MVSLSAPPANWEEAILNSAIQFMNAEVCFYEVIEGTDDFPEIGQPGTPGSVNVLWRGKARVQHIRAPRNDSTEYQASDSRSFRFQLDPNDNPPQLYSGALARVISGGRDSSLETYSFVVDSAVNSSHMAVRTVELTSDMRPMTWAWTVPGQLAPITLTFASGWTLDLSRSGDLVTATVTTLPGADPSGQVLEIPPAFLPVPGVRLSQYDSATSPTVVFTMNTVSATGGIGASVVGASPAVAEKITASWVAGPIVAS